MSFQFPGLSVSTCDCHTLHTRIGPPPLFRLQPPPELDAQTLEILGITSHPSCPNVNSTTVISSETKNLLNSSPFLVATSLVILALIILLLLFIVAACLLVRTNRRKLTIATEKLNRNYLISNSSGSDNSTNDHTTASRSNNHLFCQQFYPELSTSSSNSTASSSASPKSNLNTSFLNEMDPSAPHLVLGSLHFQGARRLVTHSSKLTNSSSSTSSSFCDSQSYLLGQHQQQQRQRNTRLPIPVSSIDDNHQYECINEVDTNSQLYFDVDEPRLVLTPVKLANNIQGYISCTCCNGGYNQHSSDCPSFIQQQVERFNRINGIHGDFLNSLIV